MGVERCGRYRGGVMVVGRVLFVVRGVLILPVGIAVVCWLLIWEMWVLWVERVFLGHCQCDLVMLLVFFPDVLLSVRVRF